MDVHTYPEGCYICSSAVSGNEEIGYLCSSCQIVFIRPRAKPMIEINLTEEFSIELEERPYVCSEESSSYHVPDCKYARRIENPIAVFESEVGDRRPCKCVQRHKSSLASN